MKVIEPSFEILAMPDGEQALALLERIGRVAYKSEDKIDDGTGACPKCGGWNASSSDDTCEVCHGVGTHRVREPSSYKFIRMILKSNRREECTTHVKKLGLTDPFDIVEASLKWYQDNPPHESVIEHCSATVLFKTNRGVTHELVRHRLCAFTQESTRYCDYDKGKFGKELTVIQPPAYTAEGAHVQGLAEWQDAVKDSQHHYHQLREYGFAPQIARGVVLHDLKADIVCTANFREWRHIFRMRCSPAAHPDMRRLMIPLREEFRRRIPIIFDAR